MRIRPFAPLTLLGTLILLVSTLTACGSTGGGASGDSPVPAPQNLVYSANPAVYTRGQAIVPNAPSNSGGAATTYAIQPAPPAGLSFSGSSGVLSGTPAVTSPSAPYLVTASNAGGSATVTLTLTVRDQAPNNLAYATNPAIYTRGVPIAPNLPSNSGGTIVTYSVEPLLPAGLVLDPASGAIKGTPGAVAPNLPYTVTGANTGGSTSVTLHLAVVDQPPASLTYATASATYTRGLAIPPNIPTTSGGQPTSYSVAPALPPGLSLHTATGVISGIPSATTGKADFVVTAANSGGSCTTGISIWVVEPAPQGLTYSFNPAVYTRGIPVQPNVPSSSGGAIASYAVSPALPSGLVLNTATGAINGIPTMVTPKATYIVTGLGVSGESVGAALSITVNDVPPSIGYGNGSYNLTVGIPAQLIPSNTGGPALGWEVSPALPSGLSLSTGTGIILGTPLLPSPTTEFMVTASNSGGSGSVSLFLKVTSPPPVITQHPQDQTVFRGASATFSVVATGGGILSYQWRRNSIDIPGATDSSYKTPPTVLSDNGAVFSVKVTDDSESQVLSSNAVLRVNSGFSLAGGMVEPRTWGASALLNDGRVLILGGQAGPSGTITAAAEMFNPVSGQFQSTSPLPYPMSVPTATTLQNGKVLVVTVPWPPQPSSALLFDPGTQAFTPTGTLATPRVHHSATLLQNGKVLVAGGWNNVAGVHLSSAEIYDPSTGTWSSTGSLSRPRESHQACLLPNGKVLIHGGADASGPFPGAEIYDPASGTFTATTNSSQARWEHALVLLPNGKVLVAGGSNYSGWILASEIFDPVTNSFRPSGVMSLRREFPTAALLGNGKVLAAGGYTGIWGDDPRCEIFDPVSETWSLGAPMKIPRFHHQGIQLLDGRVLFAGGYPLPMDGSVVATAEIYE
ncbi:MAG: putative Ig domain-containing protein [Acidobacteria bacterium]|nr:putative Ig domain-containing protein [Acidobacteriota bacterium]